VEKPIPAMSDPKSKPLHSIELRGCGLPGEGVELAEYAPPSRPIERNRAVKRCWICGREVTLDGPKGFVVHIVNEHRDSPDGQTIMAAVAKHRLPPGPAAKSA
jgi:hypothetical protein